MKRGTWVAVILLAALVLIVGCAKRESPPPQQQTPPPQPTPPAPPQVQTFFVSATTRDGLVPNNLVVLNGVKLNITSYNTDIQFTNADLGVSESIPAKESRLLTIIPTQPGTYTLICNGCPAGHDTLTIEVRAPQ
jgi:hypothetical protein